MKVHSLRRNGRRNGETDPASGNAFTQAIKLVHKDVESLDPAQELNSEPLSLDFNADPVPAFHSNADPHLDPGPCP
jgi:hypothetical protein